MTFMIFRTGRPALDLDEIVLDGIRLRSLTRGEVEGRLLAVGCPINPGAGLNSMIETYGYWQHDVVEQQKAEAARKAEEAKLDAEALARVMRALENDPDNRAKLAKMLKGGNSWTNPSK
jgi:hypothetical protein